MIVTVASAKGGVGKSTSAVHLAGVFSEYGPTLLVDADLNRSSLSWCERGEPFDFEACSMTAAAKKWQGKDHIIIDSSANPDREFLTDLAEGCDFLLLPTSPDALAMEGLLSTASILKSIQTPFAAVLTMVDSRRKGVADNARKTLEGVGIPVMKQSIRRLVCFEDAPLMGCMVKDTGHRMAGIAWREYVDLGREVLTYAE